VRGFTLAGAGLGLLAPVERGLHHSQIYATASDWALHASIGVVIGAVCGLVLASCALILRGVARFALARGARRSWLQLAVGAALGAALYGWVVGPSKWARAVPGVLGATVAAAICAVIARRLWPRLASAAAKPTGAAGAIVAALAISILDMHAYVRSYGNVHVVLTLLSLSAAGFATTVLLARTRSARLVEPLLLAVLAVAVTAAVSLPMTHGARIAVLRYGALDRLVIKHVLWPLEDRDGDGYAGGPLRVECDDDDPASTPLLDPARQPAFGCRTLAPPSQPVFVDQRAAPPKQLRNLLWVVIDTWRQDTPRRLPAFLRDFATYPRFRTCGSRTEQVLGELFGPFGCPNGLGGDRLPGALQRLGYELGHFGQYENASEAFTTRRTDADAITATRAAAAWIADRSPDKPWFAVLHLRGGHAPYGGHPGMLRSDYDAAIEQALSAASQLVQKVPSNAVVVVMGDHGEEFGEHLGSGHAVSLQEEVLATHAHVRAPGLPSGVDPRALGCPELAQLAYALTVGNPAPTEKARGHFALLYAPRGVHGGLSSATSLAWTRSDGMKVIWSASLGTWELYDLVRDPAERTNLADARPELLRELAAELAQASRACHAAARQVP